jgi:hypothetical protein
VVAALDRVGLPPLARGEELSFERFGALAEALGPPAPEA